MTDEDMQRLLTAIENRLGRSWIDIVETLRDENRLEDVAARIHAGDLDGAIQGVEDAISIYAADVHAGYVTAGQRAARWLDGEIDPVIRFDAANPRALRWAEQSKLDLVREVTSEQRDVMRRVVADGISRGENPLDVARDLRASIGLTDYQAQIVANYRRALQTGDLSGALDRELRDGRYDRSLQAALRDGRGLPPERIDAMVDRYRANWVTFRAETVARTEGLRALHQGTEELFRQSVERGDVDADQLVREWHHASVGKHPRKDHAAMNGQRRKLGERFESGSGALLAYPCDPDADPSETINCRCVLSTTLA